jgi:hypothetical protein
LKSLVLHACLHFPYILAKSVALIASLAIVFVLVIAVALIIALALPIASRVSIVFPIALAALVLQQGYRRLPMLPHFDAPRIVTLECAAVHACHLSVTVA